jgi:hypothetical protein
MHATHNEQAKLFAAALNNLGVGAIITAIVAPTVTGRVHGGMAYIRMLPNRSGATDALEVPQMSLETYWLMVPLVGIGLCAVAAVAMWLTHPLRKAARPEDQKQMVMRL